MSDNQYKEENRFLIYLNILNHSSAIMPLLIRYSISGFFVGIFYVFLGYALSAWVGFNIPISVTLSYVATTPIAFALQKKFTFKSNDALITELPRFIVVGIFLLALSTAAHKYVILPIPLIIQLFIFWLISSILNFLGYKFWVFTRIK